MDAFADGLNYYLYKHPEVKPRVIQRFEPWMALSFTEGSIGGDIERVNLDQLADVLRQERPTRRRSPNPPCGIGAARLERHRHRAVQHHGHHALLLINPHTSFFFRSELQMVSDEGLNAYGAATWGQFFIYQGFNERTGWMHTSSGVDAVDEYLETVVKKDGEYFYKYGNEERPVTVARNHGAVPQRRRHGGKEVHRLPHASRAHRSRGQRQMGGHPADAGALKALSKPTCAPRRGTTRPSARPWSCTPTPRTTRSSPTPMATSPTSTATSFRAATPASTGPSRWTAAIPPPSGRDCFRVDETPHLLNPKSGWLYNSNNWPWSAAGASSPKHEDYPAYVETGSESARGLHAIRVLENRKDFTLDSLIAAAFDSYLTWFEKPLPALIKAWDDTPAASPLKSNLAAQIACCASGICAGPWIPCPRRWPCSGAKTCSAGWAAVDAARAVRAKITSERARRHPARVPGRRLRPAAADFGKWKTPWGDINRFQRLNDDIVQPFNDAAPSIPVGFTSAIWGSLASFGARPYPGHQEVVRHQRQQLRRGGGVRPARARQGRHGRRRERRSRLAPLQ